MQIFITILTEFKLYQDFVLSTFNISLKLKNYLCLLQIHSDNEKGIIFLFTCNFICRTFTGNNKHDVL